MKDKTFSERMGVVSAPSTMIIEKAPKKLRADVYNFIYELDEESQRSYPDPRSFVVPLCYLIAKECLHERVDGLPWSNEALADMMEIDCESPLLNTVFSWLWDLLDTSKWNRFYDIVELIYLHACRDRNVNSDDVKKDINQLLENNYIGYRFVGETLAPITNQIEIDGIDSSLKKTAEMGMDGAHGHIQKALKCLKAKDYKNSIKESISAVESVAQTITSQKKPSLKGALNTLESNNKIHLALKSGFLTLYGYTSDEKGIRHADDGINSGAVGYDEAKYFVVSCSAFCYYLISKKE